MTRNKLYQQQKTLSQSGSRSSHWPCSVKGVQYKYRKIHIKHLFLSLFFNKVSGRACNFIKKEILTLVFSCEFCEISNAGVTLANLLHTFFGSYSANIQNINVTMLTLS